MLPNTFPYHELFSRILWVLENPEQPLTLRLSHIHTTLVLICHEALKDSRGSFGSLFAQTDFLCRKLQLSIPDTIEIQKMRRDSNAPRNGVTEEDIRYDCRALAILLSAVGKCGIPDSLLCLLPPTGRQRPQGKHINWRNIRGIAVRESSASENFASLIKKEGSPFEKEAFFQMMLRLEDVDTTVYVNIRDKDSYLLKTITDGTMLSLVDVHEEYDGSLSPKFIIVEPDYLLDISSLARCFTDYGHHPLAFFVNSLTPSANSQAILLGNFAGKMLDAALRAETTEGGLWRSILSTHFAKEALNYATCPDFNPSTFKVQCQKQAENIMGIVRELKNVAEEDSKNNVFLLEPSFLCPALGFQGRVDLMTRDMRLLVEQKSGKNYNLENGIKSKHGAFQKEDHYVQLLLYFAILHQNFNIPVSKLDLRLMYSRYPLPNGLLAVNYYQTLLREAIMVRNRIVASGMYFAKDGFSPKMLHNLVPKTLNENNLTDRFFKTYILPNLESILMPLQKLSPLEEAYFCRMTTFLYREQVAGCLGVQEGTTHGMSDIWNIPYTEKIHQGEIIVCEEEDLSEGFIEDIVLSRSDDREVNFRSGDSIILYRFDTHQEPDATKAVLYKGIITLLTSSKITIHLLDAQNLKSHDSVSRYPLTRKSSSYHTTSWAVEHNYSSSGISKGLNALYLFATAPKERRDLLLGQRMPENDTSITLTKDYHPSYNEVVLKAMQAKDYFILIGPPGTGKTSMAMRFIVEEQLRRIDDTEAENSGCNTPNSPFGGDMKYPAILLTSYTNRAVDEICSMLSSAEIEYLRIGSSYTCDAKYHDHLASTVFSEDGSLEKINKRVKRVPVVVATTSTLMAHQEILQIKNFSLTIIDEASQILEPDIIGLLARLGKFIMIGDYKQLPAVVQQAPCDSIVEEQELKEIGLSDCRNSLFERLLSYVSSSCLGTLHHYGRMHPMAAEWTNNMFYKDENLLPVPLQHQKEKYPYGEPEQIMPYLGGSISELVSEELLSLLLRKRILFLDVTPNGDLHDSKSNKAEATVCGRLINAIALLLGRGFNAPKNIGVIVPYRNQISLIRREIARFGGEKYADSITIDTVERFQGSQRDVILFSCTVSQHYQLEFLTSNTFTALQRSTHQGYEVDRKLNVALTRARKQTIIVGNAALLSNVPLYRSLISHSAKFEEI